MNIKSKEIIKFVCLNLNKNLDVEIDEESLNQIESLNLNYKNFKEEINEYDFSDFKCFKNLKMLILNGFEINEELIKNINVIKNLESLELNHCAFKTNDLFSNNIKSLILTHTQINNLENFKTNSTLEKIQIIDCKNVNIKDLIKFEILKEISICNSKIINMIDIKNMDKLIRLNLDGSVLDCDNIENFIRKDINFSHNEKFIYTK